MSPVPPAASAHIAPSPPAPLCMLYTMLRHGRGLSHEEAARRVEEALTQRTAPAV